MSANKTNHPPLKPSEPDKAMNKADHNSSLKIDRGMSDVLRSLFDHVEQQLARVDEKAELTITGTAILVAATALSNSEVIATVLSNKSTFVCRASALSQLFMLISLLTSFYYSFRAVIPKLEPTKRKRNLFDFGYIIQLSEEEFTEQFLSQDNNEIYVSLLSEVHTLSRIAAQKYKQLRRGFIFLFAAFGFWALSQLTVHTCLP